MKSSDNFAEQTIAGDFEADESSGIKVGKTAAHGEETKEDTTYKKIYTRITVQHKP